MIDRWRMIEAKKDRKTVCRKSPHIALLLKAAAFCFQFHSAHIHEEYALILSFDRSIMQIYLSCMSWQMTILVCCITEGYIKLNNPLCKLTLKCDKLLKTHTACGISLPRLMEPKLQTTILKVTFLMVMKGSHH